MRTWSRMLAGAAGVAVATVVMAGCSTPEPGDDDLRELTIAVEGFGQVNWDPVNSFYANVYGLTSCQPVYEGLLTVDVDTLEYVPLLAESYEISDDRRKITFQLREGVQFTDGEPLTAEGVKKSFDMVLNGPGGLYAANEMKAYGVEVNVVGDMTVEFTTTSGINMRFMDGITYLPVVSPVALDDLESLASTPVGTGPYLLDEQIPEVSTSYVRNPNYWNPDAVDFDKVTMQQFTDRVAGANALKSGQVDIARLDIGQVQDVEAAGFTIASGGGEVATLIWTDRDGEVVPALADVRVRQAISHAFDRESILENVNLGFGRVSSQNFVEGQPEYIEGGDERYPYDLEKAKQLMADAGYADGFDVVMANSPYSQYDPIIVQTLSELNIRVTFDGDPAKWGEVLGSGQYALGLMGFPAHGLVAYLSENGFLNAYGPADPIIRDLTDRMDNAPTAEERAEAAQEFGRLVLDEAWYIPFSWRYDTWGLAPGLDFNIGNRSGWPSGILDITATD